MAKPEELSPRNHGKIDSGSTLVLCHQHDAKGKAQVLIGFLYCTACDFSPIKSGFTPGATFW